MQDIINSFKAHLYERTSNPLVGSFIFYWLICNYKFIVILFDSKISSDDKFLKIEEVYKNDYIHIFESITIPQNGLLIPIIITLLYILVFPYISNFIHKIWISHQNNLKKISNGIVLTKKEFGDLQRRFTELELSFDDTFSKKDNEIVQLKKLIDKKEELNLELKKDNELKESSTIENTKEIERLKQINIELENNNTEAKVALLENLALKKEIKELKETVLFNTINVTHNTNQNSTNTNILQNDEEIVLKYIGEKPDNMTSEVSKVLNLHRIKLENIYDNLLKKELIKLVRSYSNGENKYRIQPKGREYLIEKNLV